MRVDLEEYRNLEFDFGAAVRRAQRAEAKLATARNDALEEAAKEVAGLRPLLGNGWSPAVVNVLRRASEAIKSLKSQS